MQLNVIFIDITISTPAYHTMTTQTATKIPQMLNLGSPCFWDERIVKDQYKVKGSVF